MARDPDQRRNLDRTEVRPNFKKQAASGPDGKGVPDPETIALLALAYVVGDEALQPRFLALSGIAADELRARAQDPVLLGAVLDFLLAHEPDIFPNVPDRVAVTLSGHTHGGQVRIRGYSPIVPSRFGNRYAYGAVEENGRHLVISGGIGNSMLPVRFGMPPEVTMVELGGDRA